MELERLCDLIIDLNFCVTWGAQAYFRPEMTREFLSKMWRAGCRGLFWGFETASQKIVDLMRKNYKQEIAERIIIDAHELGIENYLPLIVGYPGENASDFITTLLFTLTHKADAIFLGTGLLLVRPNSPLHNNYEKFGLANNNYFDWTTTDRKNNIAVRTFRRFVMRNALYNTSLSIHDVIEMDEIRQVDFNSFPIASELASMIYDLSSRLGFEPKINIFLTERTSSNNIKNKIRSFVIGLKGKILEDFPIDELGFWHPDNIPEEICLDNWFTTDKNSSESRKAICETILDLIRQFRDKND